MGCDFRVVQPALRCFVQNPISPLLVTFEPFVDAERAAQFLAMSRKSLLALARKGYLPGHPVGQGVRKVWKFRLSELDSWMKTAVRSGSDQGRFQERKFFR
jgi:predicted DNA-binding transcriptional regulator AlpA